ncbi:MAG: helix-hairpin-helix domain-containing protein [Candidatus Pacearchaeota archaeon]
MKEKNFLSFLSSSFISFLFFSFVSSFSLEIYCPDEVFSYSEFECNISFFDLPKEEFFDIKLELRGNNSLINQLWDGEKWQRADWYLKNVIYSTSSESFFKIKTKITKNFTGDANAKLVLRKSNTTKIFFNYSFSLKIKENSSELFFSNHEDFLVSDNYIPSSESNFNKDSFGETKKVNINNASKTDLMRIYGIGKTIAEEIIKSRPFCSIDDLIRVKGIGKKLLEKIKEENLAYVDETFCDKNVNPSYSIHKEEKEIFLEKSTNETKKQSIINLTKEVNLTKKSEKLVYESKSEKIRKISFYIFPLVLIMIIFFILKKDEQY